METIHIRANKVDSSQIESIKAFLKALKIKFELKKDSESPYDSDFVEMIKKGDQQIAEGKGIKMSSKDFKALCKLS